ncbi:hypothetical protein OZ410_03345 [Robiginitalea sp. M366]|uniref:hypothetical protein n=1 Tax=Robiginitalea aestuariiviva TaxID=3036903 RepID=UPI00240E1A8B|nr:hypothetical protein [Robiginitalea aestuariiviva]MDG1571334.1 hypothetical protein [Robiginitalea aestuariiviva]
MKRCLFYFLGVLLALTLALVSNAFTQPERTGLGQEEYTGMAKLDKTAYMAPDRSTAQTQLETQNKIHE